MYRKIEINFGSVIVFKRALVSFKSILHKYSSLTNLFMDSLLIVYNLSSCFSLSNFFSRLFFRVTLYFLLILSIYSWNSDFYSVNFWFNSLYLYSHSVIFSELPFICWFLGAKLIISGFFGTYLFPLGFCDYYKIDLMNWSKYSPSPDKTLFILKILVY